MKGNEEYTRTLQSLATEIIEKDFQNYVNDLEAFKTLLRDTILKVIKESTLRAPIIRPEILFI
jgi:hypothetical protein